MRGDSKMLTGSVSIGYVEFRMKFNVNFVFWETIFHCRQYKHSRTLDGTWKY